MQFPFYKDCEELRVKKKIVMTNISTKYYIFPLDIEVEDDIALLIFKYRG